MGPKKRIAAGLVVVTGVVAAPSAAWAEHDHYVSTPNGKCHQVASGQTAIADPEHGGHHRYHVNVHVGATESEAAPDTLGDGHARVSVFKAGPAPAVCDGD